MAYQPSPTEADKARAHARRAIGTDIRLPIELPVADWQRPDVDLLIDLIVKAYADSLNGNAHAGPQSLSKPQ